MDPERNRIPAEVSWIEERLRADRATASPVELDELKLRAKRQAAPAAISQPRQEGSLLKSRVVLTLIIVLGLMMTSTGATLAISGSSGKGNAADKQYRQVEPDEDAGTLGQEEQAPAEAVESEPTAQVAAGGDDGALPFTGFVTIPLLVGGVALLSGGAFLRWRSRD
jgi:hypothetical protein